MRGLMVSGGWLDGQLLEVDYERAGVRIRGFTAKPAFLHKPR